MEGLSVLQNDPLYLFPPLANFSCGERKRVKGGAERRAEASLYTRSSEHTMRGKGEEEGATEVVSYESKIPFLVGVF